MADGFGLEGWDVTADELELVDGKWRHTRLGFLLMLKFFVREGCFPADRSSFSDDVIGFVANQIGVSADLVDNYYFYHQREAEFFSSYANRNRNLDYIVTDISRQIAMITKSLPKNLPQGNPFIEQYIYLGYWCAYHEVGLTP